MKPNVLLTLIMLTQLNGQPIWVESTQVIIVRKQSSECGGPGHGAAIRVGTTSLCVQETPDVIREKVQQAMERR